EALGRRVAGAERLLERRARLRFFVESLGRLRVQGVDAVEVLVVRRIVAVVDLSLGGPRFARRRAITQQMAATRSEHAREQRRPSSRTRSHRQSTAAPHTSYP